MLRLSVWDVTSGFKCFSRQALERMRADGTVSRGFVFQVEMAARAAAAGLRVVEMPIVFCERRRARSKLSGQILREALGRVFVWAWRGLEGYSRA
jgi:dolichol-phosphate mannosyltransferase